MAIFRFPVLSEKPFFGALFLNTSLDVAKFLKTKKLFLEKFGCIKMKIFSLSLEKVILFS